MKFTDISSESRSAAIKALGERVADLTLPDREKAILIGQDIAQAFISLEQYDSAPNQGAGKVSIGDGTIK